MITFKSIKNQVPIRLFLKIWPPFNEKKLLDIDLSIGMTFKQNKELLIVLSTDKNDLTSPVIYQEKIPSKALKFAAFKTRMNKWMKGEVIGDFDYEYYEVTNEPIFKNIILNKITNLQYVSFKNAENPVFGVKICFNKDFILSTPTSDGNTIETTTFNKQDNLKYFGEVVYENIV